MSKHVVVTGGAGFIGSHLARRLLHDDFKVTVIDNLSTGRAENVPSGAEFIHADLGEAGDIPKWDHLEGDAVFHLAGQSSGEASFLDPFYDLKSHVLSTFHVLEWCRRRGVTRFLYSSSMSVYGDPASLPVPESSPIAPKTYYGAGKAAAEAYILFYQTRGIDTTIFRFFSVYGPGQNLENALQGMVSIYLAHMLETKPILVKGSRTRFRDFVYVDDVVRALMLALGSPVSIGRTYNVGSGMKTTVEELLHQLTKSFGLTEYPVQMGNATPGDQQGVVADASLLVSELGWRPEVAFHEGIQRMVDAEKGRRCHG